MRQLMYLICLLLPATVVLSKDDADRIRFDATLLYTYSKMDGFIQSSPNGGIGFIATTDTLGVKDASAVQGRVGLGFGRWHFSLDYSPASYEGNGVAVSNMQLTEGGPIIGINTRMKTTIDAGFLLGSSHYFVVQEPAVQLAFGIGLGQSSVDVDFSPSIGPGMSYKDNVPFGYLSMILGGAHKNWGYNVVINGLGVDQEFTSIHFFDVRITGSYKFWSADNMALKAVGGYRNTKFALKTRSSGGNTITDLTISGPNVGLAFDF